MTELYLSRIQLRNFRTFGLFDLQLPPAPGLTLLVGTNGLGKSSFFDGLEWCLTGEIRRFSDYLTKAVKEEDYLTRRDAEKNSHWVSLEFNSGDTFVRSASEHPNSESVTRLLKADRWGPIDHLGTYLAFTHFLGQAAQQRFTSRDRGEQWEALKGPSGIDRLEEVRAALRGAVTRNAFRKRLEDQQRSVEDLNESLTAWQRATAQLSRLRQIMDSKGVYSGPSLDNRVTDLERDLAAVRERLATDEDRPTTGGTIAQRIVTLRRMIDDTTSLVRRRQAALVSMDEVIDRCIALKAASDPQNVSVQQARAALSSAVVAQSTAEAARIEIQERAQAAANVLSGLEAEVAQLVSFRTSLEALPAFESRHLAVVEERVQASRELSVRREELTQADVMIAEQQSRREDLAALSAGAEAAKRLVDQAAMLVRLQDDSEAKIRAAAAAEEAASIARRRTPDLRLEEERVRSEIDQGHLQIEATRRRLSQITNAVATIASHLTDHDESCPVCATQFAPGVLQSLAASSASGRDELLASLEATQVARTARITQILSDLAASKVLIDAADVARAAGETARQRLDDATQNLATALGVEVSDDLAVIVSRRHRETAAAVANLTGTIDAAAPNVARAEASQQSLRRELERLQSRLAVLERSATELEETLGRQRASLEAAGFLNASVDSLNRLIDDRGRTSVAAREAKVALESELSGAITGETVGQQRVAAAQTELNRVVAAVELAQRDLAALQVHWNNAGLSGEPTAAILDDVRTTLTQSAADLATLLNRQSELAAANEAAIRHEELAQLSGWMNQHGGDGASDDPKRHEQELKQRRDEALKARNLTKGARTAVNAYTQRLKQEAEKFSAQFLVPLNDLIDDFNRALLSNPGESIRFNAAHNVDRTKFDMGLRYRDQLDEVLYNTSLPPQVVLSEGQMAANGFSILCAASTAYPWSNWRALLLDDPLQHNDIIHAAAFVDVMRNLAELKGYQLIMSSHDRAEGEFLSRKFDAAGLPCTIVTLTAPSKEGVRYEPPRYNGAARALMKQQLAQLA